jgi:hypothetical protein
MMQVIILKAPVQRENQRVLQVIASGRRLRFNGIIYSSPEAGHSTMSNMIDLEPGGGEQRYACVILAEGKPRSESKYIIIEVRTSASTDKFKTDRPSSNGGHNKQTGHRGLIGVAILVVLAGLDALAGFAGFAVTAGFAGLAGLTGLAVLTKLAKLAGFARIAGLAGFAGFGGLAGLAGFTRLILHDKIEAWVKFTTIVEDEITVASAHIEHGLCYFPAIYPLLTYENPNRNGK